MKILLDHCTPDGLKGHLPGHEVHTARSEGWEKLSNGKLIRAAIENGYETLITADKKMQKQQEISGQPLRVVVLTHPKWPDMKTQIPEIREAVKEAKQGRFTTVTMPQQEERYKPTKPVVRGADRPVGSGPSDRRQTRQNDHKIGR